MTSPEIQQGHLSPTPGFSSRHNEVVKHFARMVEELGRAFASIEAGRWDGANGHLYEIREQSAFTGIYLNGEFTPRATFMADLRAAIGSEWAQMIVDALQGREGRK